LEGIHSRWNLIGGILGGLGVALGAFGAHGLAEILTTNGRVDTWETASLYHLVHAVAILLVPAQYGKWSAAFWFTIGITIFSGSLYLLSITNIGWLGAITPIGGVCFLVGWTRIALTKTGKRQD
jgi:uncharacterized membrane protein YgdD (TMEM256/DUF423 family)